MIAFSSCDLPYVPTTWGCLRYDSGPKSYCFAEEQCRKEGGSLAGVENLLVPSHHANLATGRINYIN